MSNTFKFFLATLFFVILSGLWGSLGIFYMATAFGFCAGFTAIGCFVTYLQGT